MKYIEYHCTDLDVDCIVKNYEIEFKEFEIPNKPLHLYTEQEEKDLLELLLKLK